MHFYCSPTSSSSLWRSGSKDGGGQSQHNIFFKVLFFTLKIYLHFCVRVCFFRAAPAAYGGSQVRDRIGATAAGLHHSQSNPGSNPHLHPIPQPQQRGTKAMSVTYTTAHGNASSLTHWARPGIEPTTSWLLVGFINHWATTGTPSIKLLKWEKKLTLDTRHEMEDWWCSLKESNLK